MTRRTRSLAVLGALVVFGAACGGAANAQTPVVSPADEAEPSPPPAQRVLPAAAPAPPGPPVPIIASGPRPDISAYMKKYAYPVATLPGFEMLPDGGSRLFVEITRHVAVEERRTQRVLTYILKGTRVVYRNNENSLVTVHFNTPVTRARLLPSGSDLLFSVDLRADAAPSWKLVGETDGSSTLQIDFPKGSFLPVGEVDQMSYGGPRPASAPPPPPGPQPKAWRRSASRQAPPPASAPPAAVPDNAQPSPN